MTAKNPAAASKLTAIATLIAANMGRPLMITPKEDGAEVQNFRIAKLATNTSKLRDGSKGEFVIITKDGDEATVIKLHPQLVTDLFEKTTIDDDKLGTIQLLDLAQEAGAATTPAASTTDTEVIKDAGENAGGQEAAGDTTTKVDEPPKETKEEKAAKKKAEKELKAKEREDKRAADKAAKELKEKAEREERLAAKGPTAKDKCIDIFLKYAGAEDLLTKKDAKVEGHRKSTIGEFRKSIKEGGLGMSQAGANTYYQNIKSGDWKKAAVEKLTANKAAAKAE